MAGHFDALVFDLGRVLVDIDFRRCFRHWGERAGIDASDIEQRWRMDAAFEAHERGELSCPEFFDALRDRLGLQLDDDAMAEGWNAIFGGEVTGVRAALTALTARHAVYVFTNTNHTHVPRWRSVHAQLLAPVEAVFVSCELGLRKPERRAWQHLLDQLGHPAPRILFADDHLPNVAAAADFGLHAVHVPTPGDTPALMQTLLEGQRPQPWVTA